MVGINFGSDWFEPEDEFNPANWDASEQMMQVSYYLSLVLRNRSSGFPTRSDTNRAVQSQTMARGLKFRISVVEELYYPYSENKGPDQLRGYREADLRLCFRICKKPVFSQRDSFVLPHILSLCWLPFAVFYY